MGTNPYSNCSICLDTAKMSDNFHQRSFLGEFNRSPQCRPILGRFKAGARW